jgi:serine acetyltransferase
VPFERVSDEYQPGTGAEVGTPVWIVTGVQLGSASLEQATRPALRASAVAAQ